MGLQNACLSRCRSKSHGFLGLRGRGRFSYLRLCKSCRNNGQAGDSGRWWRFLPAARASSVLNWWARPLAWAARPPIPAISRFFSGDMAAKPRSRRGAEEGLVSCIAISDEV